jgi:hypothetical protein
MGRTALLVTGIVLLRFAFLLARYVLVGSTYS